MSSVHPPAPEGPMRYTCAQSGCQVCLERLLRQHAGLVHWVIRRDCHTSLSYAELLHEGQIALWRAILHYEPARGLTFSTYAVPAIRHRLGAVVAQAQRPQGYCQPVAAADPAELAEQTWQLQAVRVALRDLLAACRSATTRSSSPPTAWMTSRHAAWPPSAGCGASAANGCGKSAMKPWSCCGCRPCPGGCGACVTNPIGPPTSAARP